MSKITTIFAKLQKKQHKAFMPFVTAGDGANNLSLQIMQNYAKNNADIIEVGVPFSDPMADGPVIALSHERALANNTSLADALQLVYDFRQINDTIAIVLMSYFNPIEIYGYKKFAEDAKKSGVNGVLIVDSPPEEAVEFKKILNKHNIDLIFLVAPTTTNKRLKLIAGLVSGFVYFVSLKGVTGSDKINIDEVTENLTRIKKYIDLPICVGFGIKNAKTAGIIAKKSDGIVVATSFIEFVEKYNNQTKIIQCIDNLSKEIVKVLK